jgi:hypothetical protein
MPETLQKINIYIRPDLKIIARQAATSEGLSLSAWFRKRAHEELARSVGFQTSTMPGAASVNPKVKYP